MLFIKGKKKRRIKYIWWRHKCNREDSMPFIDHYQLNWFVFLSWMNANFIFFFMPPKNFTKVYIFYFLSSFAPKHLWIEYICTCDGKKNQRFLTMNLDRYNLTFRQLLLLTMKTLQCYCSPKYSLALKLLGIWFRDILHEYLHFF